MKKRFKLPKGSRGVAAIGISYDSKYVACADLHNDHNVFVYDVVSGQLAWTAKGDSNKITDISFSH